MKSNFKDQKVLVRVDFNVPLTQDNKVSDNTRILKTLPTLNYILDHGGSLILMSHLGRPLRKLDPDGNIQKDKFSLKNIIPELEKLLGRHVEFASDCISKEAEEKANSLKPGEVLLLENLRFHKEETEGDEDFAKKLASLGTYYVFNAFGTAHRKHASTYTISKFFDKEHKDIGFLVQAELENANKLLNNPQRPFTSIIGGAKVSDKIKLLDKLIELSDNILIGGGMAYTFIKALGGEIGLSLFESDYVQTARDIMDKAEKKGVNLLLPEDSVISDRFSESGNIKTVDSMNIPNEWMALDIGPLAIKKYSDVILNSKSIMWNGPLGVFEMEKFSRGTFQVAEAIALSTGRGAFSLIGGGDSVSAINKSGLSDKVSFISTGGGAMLKYFENKSLPCIDAITENM
jgi:phosphoglycerate kinase